jgi:AcrR family transcriptional regulator
MDINSTAGTTAGNAGQQDSARRGRPRDPELDRAILNSAFKLMVETGIRGFSVREVARRSGIPKSSIYRRWPTRAELLAAVLARLSARDASVPDTGSIRGDLIEMVTGEIAALDDSHGVLPRVALEARDDPELAEVVQAAIDSRRRKVVPVLDRASERGEVHGDLDRDAATDLVLGSIWSRLVARRPLEPAHAGEIVDSVLRGIARTNGSG